ncbi:endo-1,3-beta-glucanase [Haloferula helveola]|uniref:Endo-1,3-beta-glucanase n=1 Tax=Haloferula helveola TaxID=490095 RepID=A0ABM7R726_9BACT|nr:endo-1,3-beta-glucanase [Haloferula helveola]
MKHLLLLFFVLLPLHAEEWKLVWSDEFEGTEVDPKKWGFQIGNGFFNYDANQWIHGWGNNELQYYTEDNAAVRDGKLVITARKESLHGCGYTSARLRTMTRDGKPLFSQCYGRFEVRAKLPKGQGLWPAIWMLPDDNPYGGWAASGEIDIMEARGQEPGKVLGTIHYGGKWPANVHSGGEHEFPEGEGIDGFHTYSVEWEPGEIRWFVDGKKFSTKQFWWSGSKGGEQPKSAADLNPWPAPFDKPFHLVINLAVGGQFLGNPDASTSFPAEMQIDYVRVFEKPGGYGEIPARGEGKLPFE